MTTMHSALQEAGRKARRNNRTTDAAREVSRLVRMDQRKQRLEQFAELVADGHSVVSAAQAMGISESAARIYMRDLRQPFGWQAC